MTATSFDLSTDNKNSVNIYIFKLEVTPLCQPCYLHCTLDLELKLHTLLDLKKKKKSGGGGGGVRTFHIYIYTHTETEW